jgi:hypothetical protein
MPRSLICTCGVCAKCKHREYMRAWYARPENTERHRETARKSRERNIEKVRERDRARGYRSYDKQKEQARLAVTHAIEAGRLKREPCEVCGDANTQAHHDDYSRPLAVRWLCTTHHGALHQRVNPEPCNQIIYRDYGWKIPCANVRPCPIHDLTNSASLARSDAEQAGGDPPSKPHSPPALPLFEPDRG